MKRRYRVSMVLAAAALAVLMAGAALAASMGLIEGVNQRGLITVLPGAEKLIESDLGGLSTELFDMAVEAAVWDGRSAFVQVRFTPKNPEEYVLMAAEYPDPDEEEYIFSEEGVDIDGSKGELIGRADGRKIIRYNVRMNTNTVLNFWDVENNEDGSVTVWLEGDAGYEKQSDSTCLTVNCWWGVHGEFSRDDAPANWDWENKPWLPESETIKLELTNSAQKATVRLEAAGESENGLLELVEGSIIFTPLKGYYEIKYNYAADEGEGQMLWAVFVDAEGNRLGTIDESGTTDYSRETVALYREQEGAMQSFDPIPRTLYLAVADWGADGTEMLDRIEVKLIPEE